MDDIKVMNHLAQFERNGENFADFVHDKTTHFENMKQLLTDTRFLTAPFHEQMTAFDQSRDNFLQSEHLGYEKLQWEEIENTTLGRRL